MRKVGSLNQRDHLYRQSHFIIWKTGIDKKHSRENHAMFIDIIKYSFSWKMSYSCRCGIRTHDSPVMYHMILTCFIDLPCWNLQPDFTNFLTTCFMNHSAADWFNQKQCHVLSRLCDIACKRSQAICHKIRALCTGSRLLLFPYSLHVLNRDVNMTTFV